MKELKVPSEAGGVYIRAVLLKSLTELCRRRERGGLVTLAPHVEQSMVFVLKTLRDRLILTSFLRLHKTSSSKMNLFNKVMV